MVNFPNRCPHCRKALPESIETIPLDEAVLCVDCNRITRAKNGHCLACGGHSVLNLAAILDRRKK
jgi:hypothetical protein